MKYIITATIIALKIIAASACADDIDTANSVAQLEVGKVDGIQVSRVLASVRVGNGGGASGTMFLIANYAGQECGFGLTVAHAGYSVGDQFRVNFVDGSGANARCIDVDPACDLMLFVVSSKHVLGISPLGKSVDESDTFAIGFPGTVGPKQKSIRFSSVKRIHSDGHEMDRDYWRVDSEGVHGGDSGGGIFSGDRLIGVISHGDQPQEVYSANQPQMLKFLRRNRKRMSRCDSGKCTVTDEGPRDPWWLQPNVEVAVPPKPQRPVEQIEDDSRKDINGDREQKKAIAELQTVVKGLIARVEKLERGGSGTDAGHDADTGHEAPPAPIPPSADIDELQRELAALKSELSTLKRIPGPAGRDGRDGKDGERTIEFVLKWDDGTPIKTVSIPPNKSRVIQTLERFSVDGE